MLNLNIKYLYVSRMQTHHHKYNGEEDEEISGEKKL